MTNLRYLLPVCAVAMLGGLLFGYDTGVISGAIEPLTAKFALSDVMKGWVSGCVLIGCAAGVLAVGPFSDRFGRKATLFVSALMFYVSAIGTALANDIDVFVLFRVLGGVGIGIASISTPMYIAEISPAPIRGRMIALNQIAIVGGIAATAFINYFIAQSGDQFWLIESGWRWMFGVGMAPALLFGFLLAWLPESPRWLIEKRRYEEARAVLYQVGGEQYADTELSHIRAAIAQEQGAWSELFSGKLRKPLIIGIALAVLQQVTGINVFLYFGATIFRSMGEATGVDAGLLQQIIINGACVLFTVLAIATVDKWGRRPLMLLGAAGMGISLVAMGLMAQFASAPGHVMLFFIVLYIACFGLSVGPVTWVILAEIFPTKVRGRALGLVTFFLWLADYLVIQAFPIMDAKGSWFVEKLNHAFPFYLYALFCAVLIAVVVRRVPETKGCTLEEIERIWTREKKGKSL